MNHGRFEDMCNLNNVKHQDRDAKTCGDKWNKLKKVCKKMMAFRDAQEAYVDFILYIVTSDL